MLSLFVSKKILKKYESPIDKAENLCYNTFNQNVK